MLVRWCSLPIKLPPFQNQPIRGQPQRINLKTLLSSRLIWASKCRKRSENDWKLNVFNIFRDMYFVQFGYIRGFSWWNTPMSFHVFGHVIIMWLFHVTIFDGWIYSNLAVFNLGSIHFKLPSPKSFLNILPPSVLKFSPHIAPIILVYTILRSRKVTWYH